MRMRTRTGTRGAAMLLAILLATSLGAGGCASRGITEPAIPLDVTGPVAIDVNTFAGDVTVRTNPEITEPQVIVKRVSTHGRGRHDEAMLSLEEIGYSVDVVVGELGRTVKVRATTTHAEPHFQHADILIEVPEVDGLTVHTGRGSVEALGITGPIDVSTLDGDVVIATPRPLIEAISIVAGHGDIDLRVRGESAGRLDLDAPEGRVFYRGHYGRTVVHPGSDHNTLLASFNDGENAIVLRAATGDIRFVVDNDPLTYGLFMIE